MTIRPNSFLALARKQVDFFTGNNQGYCEVLVTCDCPRSILVMAYRTLVRMGKLVPVEDLKAEEKQIAWDMAKDIAKGRLDKKRIIELCQALMTIEFFLNL